MTNADVDDRVADLHSHLAATGELALDEEVNRWLGEAEAVAADAVGPDVPVAVVEKRVRQVRQLLDHVDDTGNQAANEHLDAARDLISTILER